MMSLNKNLSSFAMLSVIFNHHEQKYLFVSIYSVNNIQIKNSVVSLTYDNGNYDDDDCND